MAELRCELERAGIKVRHTYLQSGNVVFDAPRAPATELSAQVQAAIQPKLARPTVAVVLSARQLGKVLADAPADWGHDVNFAHHVAFVLPPMTAHQILAGRQFVAEIERVSSKGRIIYWSIRQDARARSGMTALARRPAYQNITVRTYALVNQLCALTEAP